MVKIKCPICNKELKTINASHIKTHGMNYWEFIEKYNPEKYKTHVITEFIFNFYNPSRIKFIEQVEEPKGMYKWTTINIKTKSIRNDEIRKIWEDASLDDCEKDKHMWSVENEGRKWCFGNSDIKEHLELKKTLGIYSKMNDANCFITFDIDVDDCEIVEKIWDTLNKFGISDGEILASYSGNKGYHISIFMDKNISKKYIGQFASFIIWESGVNNGKRENGADMVEIRGAGAQALKLPLSINKKNPVEYIQIDSIEDWEMRNKNGKGNFCYLTNKMCCEIDTLTKINSMKKVSNELIIQIAKYYEEDFSFENNSKINCGIHNSVYGENDVFTDMLTCDYNNQMEAIKKLLDLPIQSGNRHNTILTIATYNKSVMGMPFEENENMLIEFTGRKYHKFKTPKNENISEIKSMLKTIYKNDKYVFKSNPKNAFFSKEDILEILSVKGKGLRNIYFSIFLHYKKFVHSGNGEFFMSYPIFHNMLNINEKEISNRLKKLAELDKISFVRKGELYTKEERDSLNSGKSLDEGRYENYTKKPNIYKIKYEIKDIEEGNELLCVADDTTSEGIYKNFLLMCSKALTKKEIENLFNNAKEISKFKYQKLKPIRAI